MLITLLQTKRIQTQVFEQKEEKRTLENEQRFRIFFLYKGENLNVT